MAKKTFMFCKTVKYYVTVNAKSQEEAEAAVEDISIIDDEVDCDDESDWEIEVTDWTDA